MKKVLMRYIIPILCVALLVAFDQWTKYLTITEIPLNGKIVLIDGILELYHIRNEGMAWGMLQNQQLLFILMTPIVVGFIGMFFVRMPFTKRFIPARIAEVMLVSGAIGNMIDRMFRGESFCKGNVVDMFYVKAIDFPVFNVADSYVTISFVTLLILLLFVYKDKEFDQVINLKFKKVVDNGSRDNEGAYSVDREDK